MSAGMAAAARTGVVADNFGLDPKLQQGQLGSTSTADAINAVWAVLKTSTNPIDGIVRVPDELTPGSFERVTVTGSAGPDLEAS